MTLRVLGSIRLSRLTDVSTSPARQKERIDWWTGGNDARLVEIVEDLDVSGGLSPFKRDGLGPWLTEARAHEWDALVAWRLDRISRSAKDTLELLEWCQTHDKRIVCVDEALDTGSQWGKVFIQLAAVFAEVERTAIIERTAKGKEKLRRDGRWSGETVHYGFQAIKGTGGWRLEKDQEAGKVLRRIIDDLLGGASVGSIADALTREHVPTPRERQWRLRGFEGPYRGKAWNGQTIFKLLQSKTLLGHTTYQGQPVLVDGQIVAKAPALISLDEYRRIQAVLEGRRKTKVSNRTNNASPLLGVALCGYEGCGRPMHFRAQRTDGKTYRYYYCPDKHGASLKADELEEMLEFQFLADAGDRPVVEQVFVPAEDHTVDVEQAQETLDALMAALSAARSKAVRDNIASQIEAVDARMADLEELPQTPARVEFRVTDKTYAHEWDSRDTEGRRQLLLDSGITLSAYQERGGVPVFHLRVPTDKIEAMGKG